MEVTAEHLLECLAGGFSFDGGEYDPNFTGSGRKPWHKSFMPPIRRASFSSIDGDSGGNHLSAQAFELKSNAALKHAFDGVDDVGRQWPIVRCSVIAKALAIAVSELESMSDTPSPPNPSSPETIGPVQRQNMRSGLQLYGLQILEDTGDGGAFLDLTNRQLPFSLRLICCDIRVPLAFSNLKLVTLDLSGSVLRGLDASFLRAEGSVRIRRCYSDAPMDFAGAQIHGYFDGSDALLQPLGKLPDGQAVDSDRGMLNLSQASIDNEVRLTRAIVWGGFVARGLQTQRSVVLNDAILLSPLGVLEAMMMNSVSASLSQTLDIQPQPHPSSPRPGDYNAKRMALVTRATERLKDWLSERTGPLRKQHVFHVLMSESMRVRTSAMRADGIQVAGSLFAQNLMAVGRVRMKYGIITGGLSLQGSSLSSPERQLATFDRCRKTIGGRDTWIVGRKAKVFCMYRTKSYGKLVTAPETLSFDADDFALDLREARFGGSVRIGTPQDQWRDGTGPRTRVDGVIALDRADIDGNLIFRGVQFSWTCRVRFGSDESYPDALAKATELRDKDVRNGKRCNIHAPRIRTAGDANFCQSTGLNGLNFKDGKIGGSLAFFESISRNPTPASVSALELNVPASADRLQGRISLEGCSISSDCHLIFCKSAGPTLKAERSAIGGLLAIAAPPEANKLKLDSESLKTIIVEAENARRDIRRAAGGKDGKWRDYQHKAHRHPMIDLGNAEATLFHHPPPAWPHAGRLVVTGFRYTRALPFGPLVPPPFVDKNFLSNALEVWRARILYPVLTLPMAGLGFTWLFHPQSLATTWGQRETLFLIILLGMGIVYRAFTRETSPRRDRTKPMAIYWLDLQSVDRNAYRQHWRPIFMLTDRLWRFSEFAFAWPKYPGPEGHVYHSLEPYTRAAAALREDGRFISANLVEQKRVERLQAQLSWRTNMFQKGLSWGIGFVNSHGFSLTRPLFLVMLLVLLGAMLAHNAAINRHITEKVYSVDTRIERALPEQALADAQQRRTSDAPGPLKHLPRGFEPLLYSADILIPTIDLGQSEDWQLDKKAKPFAALGWLTFEWAFAILHVCALTVFALFLVGLSGRIGLLFDRYRE